MEQVSITSAYMWSCVIMVIFLLIAVLIANMILYKPNNTGVTQRRVLFWVLFAATGVVGFLINYIIATGIAIPSVQASYLMHSAIAAGVSVVAYLVIGFVISKIFSNSKVGTWF